MSNLKPFALLASLLFLLSIISGAEARHFRFGSVSYRQLSGFSVEFKIYTEWRRSFSTGSVFSGTGSDGRAVTGDVVDIVGIYVDDEGETGTVVFLTGDGAEYPLAVTVTHHSVAEDFIYGVTTLTHTYASPNDGGNDWLATLAGCCRQYSNSTERFRVLGRVNLQFDTESLLSKGLPVQTVFQDSGLQQVFIAANTPSGGIGQAWRIGQGSEIGDAVMPDASAVYIDANTNLGHLFVDTARLTPGSYPVVIQIASTRSVTPTDFILRVEPASLSDLKPVFDGLPIVSNVSTGSPPPVLNGFVGYEIFFTITAKTSRPGATVAEIRSFALPEGAQLLNSVVEGVPGAHTMHIDFRWTPLPTQAQKHYVCLEAMDEVAGQDPLSSGQHCVLLEVAAENPAPVFDFPPENTTIRFYLAVFNSIVINGTNDNPYDNILLVPKVTLTQGQALSPPVATEKKIKATDPATRVSAAATFTWQPGIHLGAYSETICFVLSQQGGPGTIPSSKERCILMIVQRCKYQAQVGDTIQGIGTTFESDWLSLWALNVGLSTFDPPVGQEMMIGRLYIVQPGDTLLSVATEFGTTVDGIKQLNFDLTSDSAARELPSGKEICIFPDTCTE